MPNKAVIHIDFDEQTQMVEFLVRVQENSYLALGFGATMARTSMVLWQANGAESVQRQLYSSESGQVPDIVENEWTTTFASPMEGFVDFRSLRGLESQNGFVFNLDTPITICYAWNFETHELMYHGPGNHKTVEITLRQEIIKHQEQ